MGAPCFTIAMHSFSASTTLLTRKSSQRTTYTERTRSSSANLPERTLPLKRTSTYTSSCGPSTHRSALKASSVKAPAKKRKIVSQNDIEEKETTELQEIVHPDHKKKVQKTSVAKQLFPDQQEESAALTLLRVQIQSLLENDSKRDDKALETQRKFADENEQLRKEVEAVKLKAQFDMRKNEDEAKERERALVEKVQREKDQEVNAIAERLREETQRREEKEREESRKKESDDALFKVKEELEAKAKREMDELKAKQEEEKVKMKRELDESNRKKDEELEKASKELKELKAKQEEDEARTRREQDEAKKKIEKEEAIQRVERQKDEAMVQREKEYQETILQLKQEIAAKKAKKREKKLLNKMAQLLESQKDEKRDKENQETQRLKNLKDELKITADYELQQVQILQMREELKEKERRRQQNEDDEHLKQRTSNEVMRRMALVNVGKAEYDLDVQRNNLFDKN